MKGRIEEDCKRVEVKIMDLKSWTSNFKDLKESILDETEGPKEVREKQEQLKKTEEAKRKFQGKKEGQRLSVVGGLGSKGPRSSTLASSGRRPNDQDLITHFTDSIVEPEERELRKVAKELGIPLSDATKIRCQFQKYDVDGSGDIDREEFACLVQDILCVGKAKDIELPMSTIDQYFLSADRRRSGCINLSDFLVWAYHQDVFSH
jgi:Ca2+-binding EF-hand superfamily protein